VISKFRGKFLYRSFSLKNNFENAKLGQAQLIGEGAGYILPRSQKTPVIGWRQAKCGFAAGKEALSGRRNGAQGRNRTTDTRIFSPLLYQLSYLGTGI
jgi:hypothetical protein